MALSIFLAKIIGLYLVIVSVGYFLNRPFFQRAMDNIIVQPAQVIFSGAIALIVGLLIVVKHNFWVADWTLLITLLGYWILIQGITRLWFPEFVVNTMQRLHASNVIPVIIGVMFIIGVFLLYQGFLAHML